MARKPSGTRPGPLSPYMRRKLAQGTGYERALLPVRDRSGRDLSTLRDFHHDFRRENGGRCASDPPPGAERFYRLPPQVRPEADRYYANLCKKWAARIRRTPGFARILHMITLNQFKNPGQSRAASIRGDRVMSYRHDVVRRQLERSIFEDTVANTPPPKVRRAQIPTF